MKCIWKKVVKFSTEGFQVKKFTRYLVKCILYDIHVDVFFTWNTCEAQSAKIILCKISEPILFPFTDRSDYICQHKSIRQQCINKMWTQSLLIAVLSSWRVHVSVSYINLITLYVSINLCKLTSFQLLFSFAHRLNLLWTHQRTVNTQQKSCSNHSTSLVCISLFRPCLPWLRRGRHVRLERGPSQEPSSTPATASLTSFLL